MGLDMYLNKKVYINANCTQYILEDQAYWRKANQIYNWFDNAISGGVENCKIYEITGKKLLELVELCKKVLAEPSLAEELLPTCDGFCFGSTEYDEYYFQDLRDTIEQLKDIDPECYYEYQVWY